LLAGREVAKEDRHKESTGRAALNACVDELDKASVRHASKCFSRSRADLLLDVVGDVFDGEEVLPESRIRSGAERRLERQLDELTDSRVADNAAVGPELILPRRCVDTPAVELSFRRGVLEDRTTLRRCGSRVAEAGRACPRRLMLDYEGTVEVSEEGGIVYRFEALRKTVETLLLRVLHRGLRAEALAQLRDLKLAGSTKSPTTKRYRCQRFSNRRKKK
jgi:hypothetical protein